MRSYIFKEKKSEIELRKHLSEDQPLLIEIETTQEAIRVPVIIKKGASFRGVSIQKRQVCYFDRFSLLPPSYFVIFENEGSYTTLLSLNKSASVSGGADEWILSANEGGRLMLCVQGKELYETVKLTMKYALKLLEEERESSPLPKCFQMLGWESKLSYGKYVTQEKVLNAVNGMRQQGVNPSFVTVSDGWQDPINGFDADPEKFPLGLHEFIQELHRSGVQLVGLEFSLETKYGNLIEDDLGKCFEFFNEYFKYLKAEGVGFVKCIGRNEVMQVAMKAAASIYFKESRCIVNRKFYHWGVTGSNNLRDVSINNLWQQHCMDPECYSWTTHSKNGLIEAMFHSLSGSILEVSDLPSQSNVELLRKIVLPNGYALKADQQITVCKDSVFIDPYKEEVLYKAFTKKGAVGIVGAFNLQAENKRVFGVVSSKDIEGFSGDQFVVYSDQNGLLGVVSDKEELEVTLNPHQSDIFTFVPLKNGLALIGSPSFFLTWGTITEVTYEGDSMHFCSTITAPFVIYSEREVFEIKKNGSAVAWEYDMEHQKLTIDPEVEVQSTKATYNIIFD